MEVFVLTLGHRDDDSVDTTEILGIFDNVDAACAALAEKKTELLTEYNAEDEFVIINADETDCFSIDENNFERYDELKVVAHTVRSK